MARKVTRTRRVLKRDVAYCDLLEAVYLGCGINKTFTTMVRELDLQEDLNPVHFPHSHNSLFANTKFWLEVNKSMYIKTDGP